MSYKVIEENEYGVLVVDSEPNQNISDVCNKCKYLDNCEEQLFNYLLKESIQYLFRIMVYILYKVEYYFLYKNQHMMIKTRLIVKYVFYFFCHFLNI